MATFNDLVDGQTSISIAGRLKLTVLSSVNGSVAERSSGFSRSFRKWSRRAEYADLESDSFFGHVDLSRFSNKRNACYV
jgi:hypothetical protein